MAVKLSGFADEIAENFEEQLKGLNENDIEYIEIRGVNGKNISVLTKDEINDAKKLMDKYNIKVSAVGSPIGKIKISDDFDDHLKVFDNIMFAASTFGTKYVRIFSFFLPEEDRKAHNCSKHRPEVMRRLEVLFERAHQKNLVLCHENESHIYGESPELCLDIMNYFNGAIKLVFDPANFIVGKYNVSHAYNMLADNIEYLHVKDANETGIVPAGYGNGRFKQILSDLILNRKFDGFLSIEPHLQVFKGLDDLGGADKVAKNQHKYKSKPEAFAAATAALRGILKEIGV